MADVLIAGTAKTHNLTVVTLNLGHLSLRHKSHVGTSLALGERTGSFLIRISASTINTWKAPVPLLPRLEHFQPKRDRFGVG